MDEGCGEPQAEEACGYSARATTASSALRMAVVVLMPYRLARKFTKPSPPTRPGCDQ
jgi:hypothetical protein